MSIATAVAKLAALSVPAKATTAGIAVAIAATGGVVAHATTTQPVDEGVTSEETTTNVSDTVPESVELPEASSFGQSVAEDARDGGVDGQTIAEMARSREHPGGIPEGAPAAEQAQTQTEQHAGGPALPDQAAGAGQNNAGDVLDELPGAPAQRP